MRSIKYPELSGFLGNMFLYHYITLLLIKIYKGYYKYTIKYILFNHNKWSNIIVITYVMLLNYNL